MATETLRRMLVTLTRADWSTTDRDLLRRFADNGDQAAFAALVRRHTNLVLGVCRRALRSAADAEDACQAVFVVLARKAASGRWQPSIVNWLYTTARRVCRDAQRAAERRAKREKRAGSHETPDPADQITARELFAALDDELDRLPAIYREPLVLHYLNGLSREATAARLGVPTGTVKIRLERARKKLADALTKRGLAVGLSQLTLAATSPVGAAPPQLVASILTAAGGNPSGPVAALAKGIIVSGILMKAKVTTLAVVGAAVLGFGVSSIPIAAEPQTPVQDKMEKPVAATKAQAKPAEQKLRTITGSVVGPDGKPVRAELLFLPRGGNLRALGLTDEHGAFSVALPENEVNAISHLVVRADRHGVAGRTVWRDTPNELRFVLPSDFAIRGRVIDLQGKPVGGATVTPLAFTAAASERVDDFVKVWAGMAPQESAFHQIRELPDCTFDPDPRLSLPGGRSLLTTTTDRDGRFELAGVGAERVVELLVRGPGIADTRALVVTRAEFDPDPINQAATKTREEYMLAPTGPIPSPARLFGPTPTFVVEPEKLIRGVVKDAASGEPRAGVRVTFRRLGMRDFALLRPHTATTDQDGRFEIRGSGRYRTYLIETDADANAGYKVGRTAATDTAGLEPIEVTIATERRSHDDGA